MPDRHNKKKKFDENHKPQALGLGKQTLQLSMLNILTDKASIKKNS